MTVNTRGAIDVPLSLFSGLNTELAPADIPEGVSPDNQDVAFLPGSVFSRPGLHKILDTPLPDDVTVVYTKSYVQPNGDPITLILDSNGVLWKEDVNNSPGVLTQIFQSIPGVYGKSVTAFNREYLALSDGEHGADMPLQYDGTNLDRVTQDGPGSNPCLVQDYANTVTILTIDEVSSPQGIVAATCLGTTATIQTANAHGLRVGDLTLVDGVGVSGYNGTQTVIAVPSPTTFDYTVGSTLAGSSGGTEYPLTVVATTQEDHQLLIGDAVVITGNSNSAYNNNQTGVTPSFWTVTAIPTSKTFEFQRISGTSGGTGFSVTVTVPGTAMPWSSPLNPAHSFGINDGTAAVDCGLAVSAGNTVIISSTGSTKAGDGHAYVGPTGDPAHVTGTKTGGTGTKFPTNSIIPTPNTGQMGLIAAWMNGTTLIQAFAPGAGGTFTAPSGVNKLQYGCDDDRFSDNLGSFQIQTTLASGGGTGGTGGVVSIGGLSTPGNHQVVVIFETRQGFQTAPSVPLKFATAGQKKIQVTNIPTGPANVAKRILAFTGSGGDNFFYIPVNAMQSGDVVATSTVIDNNIDQSVVVDFSDNSLFAATAIDIPGNNLFDQLVLGPCAGFFSYASRQFSWGERNKVQNFTNMGFEGGFDTSFNPLGWTVPTGTGQLIEVVDRFGYGWKLNGTGGTQDSLISQGCYQDFYGINILQPDTQYSVRFWLRTITDTQPGSVVFEIFSDSLGSLATASYALTGGSTNGKFVQVDFSDKTPASLPSDSVLRIYASGISVGDWAFIDEVEVLYTESPFLNNIFRVSYVNAPEQFDGVTGNLGPQSDVSGIKTCDVLRDVLYIYTAGGIHSTTDNANSEPSEWSVNQVSNNVGLLSLHGQDHGEEWHILASRSGPRIFDGSNPYKIGQEIQSDWESINWAAQKTIWVKNDTVNRRVYFGVPSGSAVTPNKILTLDYRELDAASQISNSGPIHIAYTGRMVSSDLARKWTRWNIVANCGAELIREGNIRRVTFGAGNGQALGSGAGTGNIYFLDPAKLTDDDFGQINPYYTTYFFVNHDQEQQLQVGSHRKLWVYVTAFVSGVGKITLTPLVDSLSNNWSNTPSYTLQNSPSYDVEWGLNVLGERCAIKITPSPLPGHTDNFFNLQKLVLTMKQEPYAVVRGAI